MIILRNTIQIWSCSVWVIINQYRTWYTIMLNLNGWVVGWFGLVWLSGVWVCEVLYAEGGWNYIIIVYELVWINFIVIFRRQYLKGSTVSSEVIPKIRGTTTAERSFCPRSQPYYMGPYIVVRTHDGPKNQVFPYVYTPYLVLTMFPSSSIKVLL